MRRLLDLLIATTTLLTTTTWAQSAYTPKYAPGDPPPGCDNSMEGEFGLVSSTGNTSWVWIPEASLIASVMKNASNDATIIISNEYLNQASLNPSQDTLYTAGWSICSNGVIALGNQTEFFYCENLGVTLIKLNDTCAPASLAANVLNSRYSATLSGVTSSTASAAATSRTSAAASTTSQANSAPVTVVVTTTASSTATGTPHHGLSVGAEAGIGVGAGLAGVAAIAAIAFFCLRRRRSGGVGDKEIQGDVHGHDELPGYVSHAPKGTRGSELP